MKEKPCKKCGFCPYGVLVEDYPLVVNPGEENQLCGLF